MNDQFIRPNKLEIHRCQALLFINPLSPIFPYHWCDTVYIQISIVFDLTSFHAPCVGSFSLLHTSNSISLTGLCALVDVDYMLEFEHGCLFMFQSTDSLYSLTC